MSPEPRHKQELLLKLFFEHGAAELAGDVDRVIATLCDHPKYELFPLNYRIEGVGAVREFYNRTLRFKVPGAPGLRINPASGNLGNLNTPTDVLWTGPESMVTSDDLTMTSADGREYSFRFLSVFTLSGYLLAGETIFMSAAAAKHVGTAVGPDFVKVPGVTVID